MRPMPRDHFPHMRVCSPCSLSTRANVNSAAGTSEEKVDCSADDADRISIASADAVMLRRRTQNANLVIRRFATDVFVLGDTPERQRQRNHTLGHSDTRAVEGTPVAIAGVPSFLSSNVISTRNSNFKGLTIEDKEKLGGIEYRSLRILLKFVICRPVLSPHSKGSDLCLQQGYFFGLHLFGALCLAPWTARAPEKYRDVLADDEHNRIWW